MGNEHADKLQVRATELADKLKSQGIHADVISNSQREYSIKVALPRGRAVIYYSPKKDTFKCQQENVNDEDLWRRVLACWEGTERLFSVSDSDVPMDSEAVDIYVDGSFVNETTAYGVVLVQRDQVLWDQVAGELQAVLKALEWCKTTGVGAITIHYDYYGIEKWVTGEWKANKTLTKQYRDAVRTSDIQVSWQKVDAHTGVKWNEYVDRLAKSAVVTFDSQPGSPIDAMTELDRAVSAFRRFLQRRQIELAEKRRSETPTPHVQLAISSGEEEWGNLNFYFTKGKGPYPRFHEVRAEEKRQQMEQLWREFTSSQPDDFSEINHYYAILKPYESLNFDFRVLAETVARLWDQRMDTPLDVDRLRYDFVELERCLLRLKGDISEGVSI
jgi:ribonuclease HI